MTLSKYYQNELNKSGTGFTLIELLVVIAIIGMLSTIVLSSLNGARQKARVAKRAADLRQIATALEFYYSDNNNYPSTGDIWNTQCNSWGGVTGGGKAANDVIPGLVPNYISSIPADPSMNVTADQNCYIYKSNGTDYIFMDYVITDMTSGQIFQYPGLVAQRRNSLASCNGVANNPIDTNNAWQVSSLGYACAY